MFELVGGEAKIPVVYRYGSLPPFTSSAGAQAEVREAAARAAAAPAGWQPALRAESAGAPSQIPRAI